MAKQNKDDLYHEKEEKEILLDFLRKQNEVLKRIYKNTLDNKKEK